MEKLKSTIPKTLKHKISKSTASNLPSTCASLHEFLHSLPIFHQLIDELTNPKGLCCKNEEAAMELKRKGNACFAVGHYSRAIRFYSQALRVAPMESVDKENNFVAVLYVNRASTFHKMGLHLECLRDCRRALAINPRYAKAWYRRGNANTFLENYEDGVRDLKMAALMEHSTSGKREIERELKIVLGEHKVEIVDRRNDNCGTVHEEMPQVKLQCVSAPITGRGITSSNDIPEATLIHCEEPYAAIMLKSFRETHCHFCFNELPADIVPCSLCTIPLYCSENCALQASGLVLRKFSRIEIDFIDVPSGLLGHFSSVTSGNLSTSSLDFHEHQHECQGAPWPTVLPTDIVLAGRMLMKAMKSNMPAGEESNQLCHHYEQLPSEEKLLIQIYSIVLINCLQFRKGFSLQFKIEHISKVVILISQIKVNSMAIVRIKSIDAPLPLNQSEGMRTPSGDLTSTVEQVRVGQAIYSGGSLFNHSCLPNIHAYFLSRTLFIRATENVARGTPLELSYGPQVGKWDCVTRQQFLEDRYSFKCVCRGCSETNLPDLVLNAFRCLKPNCSGVVFDCSVLECETKKCRYLHENREMCLGAKLQQSCDDINKVVGLMLKQNSCLPGQCLSCSSSYDLKSLCATTDEAERNIRSLHREIGAEKVHAGSISTASKSLEVLQLTLHSLNRKIAEAEEIVAQAFCLIGELRPALHHSIASVKILEKLYGANHIVIGNELVKLASLQLSLGDFAASDTINRLTRIYSKYYGIHADVVFAHLKWLRMEAS